jgi:hypothetical protein
VHFIPLILIVVGPLLVAKRKDLGIFLGTKGTDLLDYLDKANAPLGVRMVLRWGISPLAWYAKAAADKAEQIDPLIKQLELPDMPEGPEV